MRELRFPLVRPHRVAARTVCRAIASNLHYRLCQLQADRIFFYAVYMGLCPFGEINVLYFRVLAAHFQHRLHKETSRAAGWIDYDVRLLKIHKSDASLNDRLGREVLPLALLQCFASQNLKCERYRFHPHVKQSQTCKSVHTGGNGFIR